MTPVKRRVNATYHWMEGNVVTAILVSSGLSAALAVVLVGALGLYTSATFQAKSACSDATSKECAEIRLEVAEAEPLRNPCTSYQRVTGRRGKNCKRRFVGERKVEVRAEEWTAPTPDRGVEEAVAEGTSPPSRPNDAGELAPNDGRGKPDRHTPHKQPPAATPIPQAQSPASATSAPAEPPAQEDNPGNSPEGPGQSGLVKPALEGVGKTVQDTGKAVGPLTCAVTGLLHPCQP